MKQTLLLLLITIAITSASGQTTWRKGIIISNDGTELKGEVNDEEWTINPKKIEFREVGGTIKTYSVHELKSFSTNRPAAYQAFAIEYDGEDQNVNKLTTNRSPLTLSKDTLFLRVIVKAPVALYEFIDVNGRNHFFTNSDSGVEELLNRRYKDEANNSLVGVNEKYKQQLLLKASNCPDLQSSIKQLRYSEQTLRNLVGKINQCNGNQNEPIWEGDVVTKQANAGIVLQLFVSNPEFTFVTSDFSKVNFGGGLFYEIYSKKKPNRISLYNELLYKQVNKDALTFFLLPSEIKFSRVKMINSFRFSYPNKKEGRLFWGIGVGTGVRFNTLVNGKESIPGYPDYNSSEFELGLMVSAGKTFPISKSFKINAELRYELEQSPFGSSTFVGANNIGLCVGFNLK